MLVITYIIIYLELLTATSSSDFQFYFNINSEILFFFFFQGLSATPSRPSNVAVEGAVELPSSEVRLVFNCPSKLKISG